MPAYLHLEPATTPRRCIIWLHGLGADGYDFLPVAQQLRLPEHGFRVFLPHAPAVPVSLNQGYVMPAWYDLYGTDLQAREDTAGIRRSSADISALIDAQVADGIAAAQIVLAGFSQGGAIALHAGTRYREALGGILALSTYLPLAATLEAEQGTARPPVFIGHGEQDPVVPYAASQMTQQLLQGQGYAVTHKAYRAEHTVTEQELEDIAAWLGLSGSPVP